MSDMNLFVPITKVDVAQRLVYGALTAEVVDKSGEMFDYETGKPAFQKWSDDFHAATAGNSKGNLRAMHGKIAAGKFTDISFDDETKTVYGAAKVVDDAEWNKVVEGVYTGFSIGGSYAKRWADPSDPKLFRFTPSLSEVSLVDNPCVGKATFEIIKEDGSTEMRKFHVKPEDDQANDQAKEQPGAPVNKATNVTPDLKQGWQAKDGSFHLTKAEAAKHNDSLDVQQTAQPALEALDKAEAALSKVEAKVEAAVEAAKPVVEKAMYDIGTLAGIIASLVWLDSCIKWEAMVDGDETKDPQALKACITSLCTFLRDLVAAETGEIMMSADKFAPGKELAKMVSERDHLAKAMAQVAPQIEKLLKRIEVLECTPMPVKGVARVVSVTKEADAAPVEPAEDIEKIKADYEAHLATLTPEARALEMIKVSLANPKIGHGK